MRSTHMTRTQVLAFAERIGSTFLFAALGVVVVYLLPLADGHHGLSDIAWLKMLSAAAVAGLLSTIKCLIAALADGNPGIGSFEAVAVPGTTAAPADGGQPVEVTPAPSPEAPDAEQPTAVAVPRDVTPTKTTPPAPEGAAGAPDLPTNGEPQP